VTVVEADEFDRSFLHLHPDIACVTSTDADHLDIYGDSSAIEASFQEFADKVEDKSKLFVAKGLKLNGGITVAVNEDAQFKAFNVRIENSEYVFDANTNRNDSRVRFALPGKHNLTNALMALAMAKTTGYPTRILPMRF
jgi:UDP-N-acetylmuramate--alanine ligase